jgi:hypothetical protein
MKKEDEDLASPRGLINEVSSHWRIPYWNSERKTFCWRCRDKRRVEIQPSVVTSENKFFAGHDKKGLSEVTAPYLLSELAPALFCCTCIECRGNLILVVIPTEGPEKAEIAVLLTYTPPGAPGAPSSVAFYLDQAQRAKARNANSAVVAMYRSALDQLLFDQGFRDGTTGQKIDALKAARTAGTAPPWANKLDATDMSIIKRLGDGAAHAKGGDVERQKELDGELVQTLDAFFAHLLYEVYELPETRKKQREDLAKAASKLTAPATPAQKAEKS